MGKKVAGELASALLKASLNVLWGRADIGAILSEVWSLSCPEMEQFVTGCKALLLTFNMYTVYIKLHLFWHIPLCLLHLSNAAEHPWK